MCNIGEINEGGGEGGVGKTPEPMETRCKTITRTIIKYSSKIIVDTASVSHPFYYLNIDIHGYLFIEKNPWIPFGEC